jgi:hypothetical protein
MNAAMLIVLFVAAVFTQDATEARVMGAVRAALAAALPFPETDASGTLPADGKTEPLWMVRAPEPGDPTIEVIANPLNAANQLRAARAMAQIQNNVEAAQRRAEAQYTGKSQEVDGVTLGDEGVAGAKIDAESHVVIAVAFNQPAYKFAIASSIPPAVSTQVAIPGATVVAVPSNTYRDELLKSDRYAAAETLVFLGRLSPPAIDRQGDNSFVIATAAPASDNRALATLVLHFSGNEVLMADLLRKTNWNALVELLK